MHLFLTGNHDAGKSTIINEATQSLPFIPTGFFTFISPVDAKGVSTVHMKPYGQEPTTDTPVLGVRNKDNYSFKAHHEAFDTYGVEVLEQSKNGKLIIMDELGFMERDAKLFQYKVIEILKGSIPVLGAIKRDNDPFLNQVRDLVRIIEVDTSNRKEVLEEVKAWLKF